MIVAISPFSDSEKSGHSLLDDVFYFEYLMNSKEPFKFYAPLLSAQRLKARFPEAKNHILGVKPYRASGWGHVRFARQLRVQAGSKVIFFGYSEYLVLTWYLINLFNPFSMWLIATNNIGAGRVDIYRMRMKFFFRAIRGKLKKIVLHTEYEVRLLDSLNEGLTEIVYVKKHHLMASIRQPLIHSNTRKIVISFFGPQRDDKPIEPFLHLISSDSTGYFEYRIYNVPEIDVLFKMALAKLPDHVSVIEGWKSYEAHIENCLTSDIIFMAHTHVFEGKLSGNLCDCVALGIPYICAPIEPMLSLHKEYGALGYLSNFSQPGWPEQLIALISWDDLLEKQKALQRIASDYSIDSIKDDLGAALNL